MLGNAPYGVSVVVDQGLRGKLCHDPTAISLALTMLDGWVLG